ncbi:MAG: DUF3768 domain-containing protein [Pseudomonadota bacterium]
MDTTTYRSITLPFLAPVALVNDDFRKQLKPYSRSITVTDQVQRILWDELKCLEMMALARATLIRKIRRFEFGPHHKRCAIRDYGTVDWLDGHRFDWKIRVFDPTGQHGAEDAADPDAIRDLMIGTRADGLLYVNPPKALRSA